MRKGNAAGDAGQACVRRDRRGAVIFLADEVERSAREEDEEGTREVR